MPVAGSARESFSTNALCPGAPMGRRPSVLLLCHRSARDTGDRNRHHSLPNPPRARKTSRVVSSTCVHSVCVSVHGCVWMCVCACISVCASVCVSVSTCLWMCACVHTSVRSVCVDVRVCVCVCPCTSVCGCVPACAHVCVRPVCLCVCILCVAGGRAGEWSQA